MGGGNGIPPCGVLIGRSIARSLVWSKSLASVRSWFIEMLHTSHNDFCDRIGARIYLRQACTRVREKFGGLKIPGSWISYLCSGLRMLQTPHFKYQLPGPFVRGSWFKVIFLVWPVTRSC